MDTGLWVVLAYVHFWYKSMDNVAWTQIWHFYVGPSKKAEGTKVWTMSRERKFGTFYVCRSKKAGGTKVWTMSREHARIFFLVRILLVRSQKYRQTMSRVNACS